MKIEELFNRIYRALPDELADKGDFTMDLLNKALEWGLEEDGAAEEGPTDVILPPQFFVTDWPGTRWLQELRSEISYTGEERDVDEIVRLYTVKYRKVVTWTEESKRLRDPGPFYKIEDREFRTSIRVIRDELRDAGQGEWNTWTREEAIDRFKQISGKAVAFDGW